MSKKEEQKTDNRKRTTLVSSGEKWNFEEQGTFIGRPTQREEIVFEDDGVTVRKNDQGQDMNLGRYFIDEHEEEYLIPHYSSIDKALNQKIEGGTVLEMEPLLEIRWLGKTEHKGKPWHRFAINLIVE